MVSTSVRNELVASDDMSLFKQTESKEQTDRQWMFVFFVVRAKRVVFREEESTTSTAPSRATSRSLTTSRV